MGNMFKCTLASGGALILTVTCDSAFAGQTITCTDGTTTLTQICPSTSPYTVEFRIPNGGTWTISSGTDSTSVVIPDAIELHYIPNGSTVTPTNDIEIWLRCAEIYNTGYTTISEVLADASTLQALIASTNAVDYMARSTTWSTDVTADSSAMSYIGLNDYCADSLLADSTWLNAICDSTYFESVLNVKIPTMTSATTPKGEVTGSAAYSNVFPIWACVSGLTDFHGCTLFSGGTKYWQYEFEEPIKANCFEVSEFGDEAQVTHRAMFTNAKIQGSNDGVTFTDLFTISQVAAMGAKYKYNFANATKYKYYRLSDIVGGYSTYVELGKLLNFYGRA